MSGETMTQQITRLQAYATGSAAVFTTVAATLMEGAEGNSSTFVQNIIQVGGPTLIGAAVANMVYPSPLNMNNGYKTSVFRGLIAGLSATTVLWYAGAMPAAADMQTLSFITLIGASVAAGDYIAIQIANQKS